ncbi:MAG: hypothetical protein PHQ56_06035 [Dysgonamonadaceae bacterium]|jgi:hypothetical protein|nr:hypothetical protein [Dysgonamonadaceae bacterium]MDD3355414.1 hypothetical protein [Dysgonamonadaceae bacterium]MDD3727215.1 hypothetical protein [Dysgonamonadaceae bacterium]MDD4605488.1 hypothetical protein [Dysgonamonadaceae bacterium]
MKQESVLPLLKGIFIAAFAIQAIIFIAVAFKQINILPTNGDVSLTLERYVLLLTLISIPGALKLFSWMMKKNKHPESKNETTKLYIKAYLARFSILFIVASINIVLYAISYRQNFMLFTLVTFTTYLFCYPSESYLRNKEV